MVNNVSTKKDIISGENTGVKEERSVLSGDQALTDPKDDRLGYAPFAKQLSQALCEMAPSDGMVVSINGPWGSGKTTVLNFIRYYLKEKERLNRQEIIYFNPWWFSGGEDLTQRFFEHISRAIDRRSAAWRRIRRTVAAIGKAFEKTPKPGGFLVDIGGRLCGRIGQWMGKTPDLGELREKAEKLLRGQSQRLVVFIDDIDRLESREIGELFRTIKAIAGLSNVLYVVAFDKCIVVKALESMKGVSGEDYLEKIVQVPFDLPLPDRASIRQLLFERLDRALGPLSDSDFDQQRWANVYLDGIDPLIHTPRDVTRLCNAISVTFPAVREEVNPVDFVAIEAIRVFLPSVYESIRANSEQFTGTTKTDRGSKDQLEQEFHQGYRGSLDASLREPVKLLLQRLFPKLENMGYASEFEREWRRELRVCSNEVFPVYFRLQLGEGDIGAGEMRGFLDISGERTEVVKRLRSLNSQKHRTGVTRARALLERLEDYTEKAIPEKNIKAVLLALFDVGDELRAAEPERREMYDFGVEMQVARIVYQLLRRLSEKERFDLMKTAINNGEGIVTIIYEVSLHQSRGEKTQAGSGSADVDIFPSRETMEELTKLATDRIARESEKDSLLMCGNLGFILHCWKMWDKSDKYQKWVNTMRSRKDFIVALLTSSLGITFSAGMGIFGLGDRVAKREYRIDLKFIRCFVELDEIKPIAGAALKEGKLSDRERLAIETFFNELERPEDIRGGKIDEREG